jgi:hypothetical protein
LLQTASAQSNRTHRIFSNSDTCNTLLAISEINELPRHSTLKTLDKYQCIKKEVITLRKGFTWLSFPRLTGSNPSVNSVIGGDNIIPNSDPNKYQIGSYLENLPLGGDQSIFNYYDGTIWPDNNQGTLVAVHINNTGGASITKSKVWDLPRPLLRYGRLCYVSDNVSDTLTITSHVAMRLYQAA